MSTLFDENLTLEEAQELIRNGADVNERDEVGSTPIFGYAESPHDSNIHIIKLLLDNGAEINAVDEFGESALFFVINMEIAQLLIQRGADVHIENNDGQTPLFFINNENILRLLLQKGADINHIDDYGRNALSNTLTSHHYQKKIPFLIANGAIPSTVDSYKTLRHIFSQEQQKMFDVFMSISGSDKEFIKMCRAYQEGIKNNMDLKDMDIL